MAYIFFFKKLLPRLSSHDLWKKHLKMIQNVKDNERKMTNCDMWKRLDSFLNSQHLKHTWKDSCAPQEMLPFLIPFFVWAV